MYKVKNGLSFKPVSDLFTTQQSAYNLRQSDLSLPRVATVTYEKHSLEDTLDRNSGSIYQPKKEIVNRLRHLSQKSVNAT